MSGKAAQDQVLEDAQVRLWHTPEKNRDIGGKLTFPYLCQHSTYFYLTLPNVLLVHPIYIYLTCVYVCIYIYMHVLYI